MWSSQVLLGRNINIFHAIWFGPFIISYRSIDTVRMPFQGFDQRVRLVILPDAQSDFLLIIQHMLYFGVYRILFCFVFYITWLWIKLLIVIYNFKKGKSVQFFNYQIDQSGVGFRLCMALFQFLVGLGSILYAMARLVRSGQENQTMSISVFSMTSEAALVYTTVIVKFCFLYSFLPPHFVVKIKLCINVYTKVGKDETF